jgi:hypothetical protein
MDASDKLLVWRIVSIRTRIVAARIDPDQTASRAHAAMKLSRTRRGYDRVAGKTYDALTRTGSSSDW